MRLLPERTKLSWLLVPLLLTTAVSAQEKPERYDLSPHYELGDKQETEARMSVLLKIRLRLAAANIDRTSEQETVVKRRYRDELTQVDGGKVSAVERHFVSAWTGEREPGAPRLTRKLDPMHQRTIVIRRTVDGKRRVRPKHGQIPADAIAGEMPTERYEAVLPGEPVKVGESWKVEGDAFLRAIGKGVGLAPEGKLTCTLKEVREEALPPDEPERFAIVGVELEAKGKQGTEADAATMRASLSGELRFSLKRKKIVTVSLRGEAWLSQVRQEEGQTMELSGRGPMEIKKRIWFPAKPRRRK